MSFLRSSRRDFVPPQDDRENAPQDDRENAPQDDRENVPQDDRGAKRRGNLPRFFPFVVAGRSIGESTQIKHVWAVPQK